ncbi:MAG: hypothetical protein ACNI27_13830 [Desulfovibrio sp.]
MFVHPVYSAPDFSLDLFRQAPLCTFSPAPKDGVAPSNYHATSVFPEYLHLSVGQWAMPEHSRMDCVIRAIKGKLDVIECRRIKKGDMIATGRTENGEEGIYVHPDGFLQSDNDTPKDKFSFRSRTTRESSFSIDYDQLYSLLKNERENGKIIWVAGPAVVFDSDARQAFTTLIEEGFVHGLLAGNALATHDLEGALHNTALGQDIYTGQSQHLGHYNHLDTINTIRQAGSIRKAAAKGLITSGVMKALEDKNIPYVLAGSIRDDGPLPEVITDSSKAQNAMRQQVTEATTVITLATQLHTIATGNMTPSYTVRNSVIRPVYFFSVDMSEFAADKLANRGSLTARAFLTNVQDFIVNLQRGVTDTGGMNLCD